MSIQIVSINSLLVKRLFPVLVFAVFLPGFCWSPGAAAVQIDQMGYPPDAPKYAFSSDQAGGFSVVDVQSGAVHFSGSLDLWVSDDPSTGLTVYRGSFGDLHREGTYRICTSAGDSSQPFVISASVYSDVFMKSLKGFYYQRCGTALTSEYAGLYTHKTCHSTDGFYHSSSDTAGYHGAGGGWHDAGDYGKYIVNAGISVGTMLMAWELFPDRFESDDTGIPESANSIPDILDEVRFEMEWMLRMQGPDGGVYHKLTREQFEGFVMPQNDTGKRYIYRISSAATGGFAAVMALAARVYDTFDPDFAATCRSASEYAWQYLEAHPSIVPPGGFKNPSGTETGEYGDGRDSDERLWAAIELFLTTGNSAYHAYYSTRYQGLGLITAAMSWPNVAVLAHLAYLYGEQEGMSVSIKASLKSSLVNHCQGLIGKRNASGFHVVLQPGQYSWGCNSAVLNEAILLILGYDQTGNEEFREVALDQLHYILGANAHGMSFVTGMGSVSPLHPHHRPSGADGIDAPVPGLLAGGPNQYLQDEVLRAHFDSSTPPALCYIDAQGSYASNEICINWNAPLVFVAGYFAQEPCSGQRGDVNEDGIINILDVVAVVNHILQITPLEGCALTLADVNNDDVTNILDVIAIVNIILGEIPGNR